MRHKWILPAVLLLAAGLVATPADAATVEPKGEGQHCAVVLDRLQPGETSSRALRQQCSADEASLQSVVAVSTPLVKFFDCTGWHEPCGSVTFYGTYGTCDRSGYGWRYVGDAWNDRFSSLLVYAGCWTTVLYKHRDYVDCPYGGITYGNSLALYKTINNEASSFRILAPG
jgi:hypothetical protein